MCISSMKTIKELEYDVKPQPYSTKGVECHNKLVRIQTLKDVIKLIDERIETLEVETIKFSIGGWPDRMVIRCRAKINELEELKARIEG